MRKGKKVILIVSPIVLLIGYLVLAVIFDLPLLMTRNVYYFSPVWSQDSKRIFYIEDINYWKLTPGSIDSITLGGSGFSAKYKSYIISMNPYGWDKKVVTKFITKIDEYEGPTEVRIISTIPNRNEIIFFIQARSGYKTWIYKVNVNGANLLELVNLGKTTKMPGLFVSPDGTKIAYTKERYDDGSENTDIIGSVLSSWLMDSDGKNNHMICGEESEVVGWTTNGKLVISAYADSEGNAKLGRYSVGHAVAYPDEVKDRVLVYDQTLNKFVGNMPDGFYGGRLPSEFKNSGLVMSDTSISPDGKMQIIYDGPNKMVKVKNLGDKSEIILLRW